MPVSAEDAIWGATDKEMVRCTGSFSYAGWKLTGGKKPVMANPIVEMQTVTGRWQNVRFASTAPSRSNMEAFWQALDNSGQTTRRPR